MVPSLLAIPYGDFTINTTSSTTVTETTVLTPLSAIFQAFPSRADPISQAGVLRLKQRIRIRRLEVRVLCIGSQGSALLPADLYNSIRFALYTTGKSFGDVNTTYLTGVYQGTTTQDVTHILMDETSLLSSQAFDSSNYNAPNQTYFTAAFNCNWLMTWFSSTATGTGGAWDSQDGDLIFTHISDSSVAPNPTVNYTVRTFFEYV